MFKSSRRDWPSKWHLRLLILPAFQAGGGTRTLHHNPCVCGYLSNCSPHPACRYSGGKADKPQSVVIAGGSRKKTSSSAAGKKSTRAAGGDSVSEKTTVTTGTAASTSTKVNIPDSLYMYLPPLMLLIHTDARCSSSFHLLLPPLFLISIPYLPSHAFHTGEC